MNNDISGEELIATAGAISFALAKCLDNREIAHFVELLRLVCHNLDTIRFRRHMHEKHEAKQE